MEQEIEKLIERFYDTKDVEITCMGGGFYGRVYKVIAELPDKQETVIVKLYLQPDIAKKEKNQLEALKVASHVKVPTVHYLHKADRDITHDALIMEYVDGVNGGNVLPNDPKLRSQIADEVTDALLELHATNHPEGFGELDADSFVCDWRDQYKRTAESILNKATKLYSRQRINDFIMTTVQEAFNNFDRIFYLPITKAALIHGDYNMWNVLLDDKTFHMTAIIDPYGCCYGDPEFDLYQLKNANGKEYKLLETYKAKTVVSDNFEAKMAFYEVFTEIMHYYDSDVKPNEKALELQVQNLKIQSNKLFERK